MNIPNKKIVLDNQTDLDIEENFLENFAEYIFVQEKLEVGSFVNLRLSNDGEIKTLNAKYLGRNESTDVISFEADLPGIPFLGDIIINTNVANRQKGKHSLKHEIALLFLHGLLHLLGYDHLDTTQAKIMYEKENEYKEIYKELNK